MVLATPGFLAFTPCVPPMVQANLAVESLHHSQAAYACADAECQAFYSGPFLFKTLVAIKAFFRGTHRCI